MGEIKPDSLFDIATGRGVIRAVGELVGKTWMVHVYKQEDIPPFPLGALLGETSFTSNPPLSPTEAANRTQQWVETSATVVSSHRDITAGATQFGRSFTILRK